MAKGRIAERLHAEFRRGYGRERVGRFFHAGFRRGYGVMRGGSGLGDAPGVGMG